ncbi:hypothetical protein ACFE04_026627 [Oxalis oulophora]
MAQENNTNAHPTHPLARLATFCRTCIFRLLSVGPIPTHLAFIMDGNRRFAKKHHLQEGTGHKAGYMALMRILKYCHELRVKYVTVYAFSIDNFRRSPDEVKLVMDLMLDKIQGLLQQDSIVAQYGLRVHFIGTLHLLSEPVRIAAQKVMKATAKNNRCVLLICVAYTATDEITRAVEGSCRAKCDEKDASVKLVDIEKHMYMAVAPEPDVLVRTSGESRLSNFLLWQSSSCLLYAPNALWPEIGLGHLIWAILNFQRKHSYLEKKKKMT